MNGPTRQLAIAPAVVFGPLTDLRIPSRPFESRSPAAQLSQVRSRALTPIVPVPLQETQIVPWRRV
jgi:hypothetical protein